MKDSQDGIQNGDLDRMGFFRRNVEGVKYGLAIIVAIWLMVMSFAYWAAFIY